MLLVELSLPSGLARVSNEPLALEHFWAPHVASCGPVKMAIDKPYGGYVRPQFGSIELLPTAFRSDWPPPVSMGIAISVTDLDEAGAMRIMDGTAHRSAIARDGIRYDIYGSSYTGRFTDHSYDNTISGLFANNIPYADASLSTDVSLADDTNSPRLVYVDSGDQVVIDSLSKTCACAGHLFYIDGTVAHLVDMFTDNGSRALTEFDFFPSSYKDGVPIATVRCGDTAVPGSSVYGQEEAVSPVFNTSDTAEIEKGLSRIKTILESPGVELKLPITATVPKFGERLSWTDASLGQPVDVWMRTRALTWDFDQDQLVIEGEGGIS